MKKKLSYRDKLVELAYIYDVKEIKDYEKSRKNLTSGQLELILKKNKITIPKDFKSNFLRDNIIKPVGKIKSNLIQQLTGAVKWTQTSENMLAAGANHFTEVGPGKVLQGLIKKVDRKVETLSA